MYLGEEANRSACTRLAADLAQAVKGKTTRGDIARALHRVLFKASHADGQTATIETALRSPEKNLEFNPGVRCWHVLWESGPHEWAIVASFVINEVLRANGAECYVEPYHRFSLVLSTVNLKK